MYDLWERNMVQNKKKKNKKPTLSDKLTLSDKFQELPHWVPSVGFVIILLIVNFTIGIEYAFFFLLAALCCLAVMAIFVGGMEVFNFGLPGVKNKTVGLIIGGIIGLIIFFLPLILHFID